MALLLEQLQSYAVAVAALHEIAQTGKTIDLSVSEERGVDVAPPSFRPVIVRTKILEVTALYADFSVRCLSDTANLPTAIPAIRHGKKSVAAFYAWVAANQERIATMSFADVLGELRRQRIRFHQYCAMD